MSIRDLIKNRLPISARRRIRDAATSLQTRAFSTDLNRLALFFGTDKWGGHWYTQHYQQYLEPLRKSKINLVEIGVGGYADNSGGNSLRMWKQFFRSGKIVGIDIEDKTRFRESRIDIRQCDQTDAQTLRLLSEEYGGFDIIVDDGSHINDHVVKTFQILFPLLRPNGIYAIEDVQTSYWPSWGGGISSPQSCMAYFKSIADGLNHSEYPSENYKPNYFDTNVLSIVFFHNLILVRKGDNSEVTNAPALVEHELRLIQAG